MRYILKETFLDYLDQNGTKERYFDELKEQAIKLFNEGMEEQFIDIVDIHRVNKQFRVDVNIRWVMIFIIPCRIKIRLGPVEELSLDEYIEYSIKAYPEITEVYNQMIALMV